MSGEINKGIIINGGSPDFKTVAVGDNAIATSTDIHHSASQFDMERLAAELQKLREALGQKAQEGESNAAVVAVAAAENAAKNGDEHTALEYLKQAGKWALDVAKDIGVSVATEALNTALKG